MKNRLIAFYYWFNQDALSGWEQKLLAAIMVGSFYLMAVLIAGSAEAGTGL